MYQARLLHSPCRLGCWCSPEMCHGDILVELVNKFCLNDDTVGDVPAGSKSDGVFESKDDFPSLDSRPLVKVEEKELAQQQRTASISQEDKSLGVSPTACVIKQEEASYLRESKWRAAADERKSKRKRHRTPHLYMNWVDTPKWNSSVNN